MQPTSNLEEANPDEVNLVITTYLTPRVTSTHRRAEAYCTSCALLLHINSQWWSAFLFKKGGFSQHDAL